MDRIISRLETPQWVYTTHILLFCIPGVPSLYYGSEWAIGGQKQELTDRELRPAWDGVLEGPRDMDLEKFIRTLSVIRKNQPPLRYGEYQNLIVDSEIFAFSRKWRAESIFIFINISEETREIDFPNYGNYAYTDLLNHGEKIYAGGGMVHLKLYPYWGLILKPLRD